MDAPRACSLLGAPPDRSLLGAPEVAGLADVVAAAGTDGRRRLRPGYGRHGSGRAYGPIPAPPVSVERAAAPAVETNRAEADDQGDSPPVAPVAATRPVPTRAQVARQMAREAFEAGHAKDGVWYYRLGVRAQRRAPDDDTLTVHTINALSDQRAAAAAERLLRDLGRDARPLLAETARSHPDRAVRERARQIATRPQPRPFLRWLGGRQGGAAVSVRPGADPGS